MSTNVIVALIGMWGLAAVAWAFYECGRQRTARVMVFVVFAGFTLTTIESASPTVDAPEPEAVSRAVASLPASSVERPALSLEPVGTSHEAASVKYLASRNGKTYHLPSCSHYAPYIRGAIWYDSKAAAETDGKRPCSECLAQAQQPQDKVSQKASNGHDSNPGEKVNPALLHSSPSIDLIDSRGRKHE